MLKYVGSDSIYGTLHEGDNYGEEETRNTYNDLNGVFYNSDDYSYGGVKSTTSPSLNNR